MSFIPPLIYLPFCCLDSLFFQFVIWEGEAKDMNYPKGNADKSDLHAPVFELVVHH